MAIFHLHVKTIKRSQGRSATAAAAYRAGEDIFDEKTATWHRYSRRTGVSDSFLLFAAGVPQELQNRSSLHNALEKAERRKDAVVARELILALPWELNRAQRRALAQRMGWYLVWQLGVAVDVAIHEPSWKRGHDIRNQHAHILFSTRRVNAEGVGEKTRELDVHRTGRDIVKAMRRAWQDFCNEALAEAGFDTRIDCRTLVEQGIFDRIAQIHKGPKVQAMLDRGINPANLYKLEGQDEQQAQERSRQKKHRIPYEELDQGRNRGQWNDQIIETNVITATFGSEPLELQIKKLIAHIDSLMHTMADLEAFIPRNLLPEWVRRKVEWAWLRAVQMMRLFQEEKEEERKRHEEREGRHEKMRRIRQEIRELEEQKRKLQAVQRLYMRMEHQAITQPIVYAPAARPVRELTNAQYRVELHFKAETARAAVPPEYRPRIERPATSPTAAAASVTGKSSLAQAMPAQPKDNGGLAKPPRPLKANFNAQADPQPEPSYRQKVRVGFGPGG